MPSIEDEISKLFRIHSRVFNDFIHKKLLGDILEDILGPDVDCFLSQYILKNPGAWGPGIKTPLISLLTESLRWEHGYNY